MYIFVDEINSDKFSKKNRDIKTNKKNEIITYSFCYFENDVGLKKTLRIFNLQLLPEFLKNKNFSKEKNSSKQNKYQEINDGRVQLLDEKTNEGYRGYEEEFKNWVKNDGVEQCQNFLNKFRNEFVNFFILEVDGSKTDFNKLYGPSESREKESGDIFLHRYQIVIGNFLQNIVWKKFKKNDPSKLIIVFLDDFSQTGSEKGLVKKNLKRRHYLQFELNIFLNIFYDLELEGKRLKYATKVKKGAEMTQNGNKKGFYELLKPQNPKFNFHIAASYLDSKTSSFLWLNEIVFAIFKTHNKGKKNKFLQNQKELATKNIVFQKFNSLYKENVKNFKKIFLGKVKEGGISS